ncbi:9423_t:CDS:2 [Acaulospora morrowiae]|uniref:9423_t:CDS:1 n=1 Tax=Acaulospora morrowiae TaxID=94023 RepID=A0A9N9F0K3_9GLOM|nr:9423_t:CDS:2 [Acaulospora morrowiae]
MSKEKSFLKSSNKYLDPYTVTKILIQEVKVLQDQNKIAFHTAVVQYYNFYDKNYHYISLEDTSSSQDSFLVSEDFQDFFKDILTELLAKDSIEPKISDNISSFVNDLN